MTIWTTIIWLWTEKRPHHCPLERGQQTYSHDYATSFFWTFFYIFVSFTTYSTESRGNLVGGSLHDADQCGDEAHLHGALAAFDLCQFLKDILSQGRHHGVWGEQRRQSLRKDKRLTSVCFLWGSITPKKHCTAKRNAAQYQFFPYLV